MNAKTILGVVGLLLVAAVAVPLVSAAKLSAGKRADTADCTTTETSQKSVEILANGTRRRETVEEVEVDCRGSDRDTHFVDARVKWDEDYDGPACESERRVVVERETLANGTRRETVDREESRDCPGTSKDFSTETSEVRYLSDKEKTSWLRKTREKMDDNDTSEKPAKAEKADKAEKGEKGLRNALKHVPSHVADRIRALIAAWRHA